MKIIISLLLLAALVGCASVTPNRDEAKTRTVNLITSVVDVILLTK